MRLEAVEYEIGFHNEALKLNLERQD